MSNEVHDARERLREARDRVELAEREAVIARSQLEKAEAYLDGLEAGLSLTTESSRASEHNSDAAQAQVAGNLQVSWPNHPSQPGNSLSPTTPRRWEPREKPPPAYKLLDGVAALSTDGQVRKAAPAGWKSRRVNTTVGVVALAVGVSLLFHWVSQMIVGAMVGAAVGLEGLSRITSGDLEMMNTATTVSTIAVTFAVVAACAVRTAESLTWPPSQGDEYGMSWWRNAWAPILVGTGVHAAVFWLAMVGATTAG